MQSFTHAATRQGGADKFSVRKFAALLDCSSMHDDVHCECRDRPWPLGLRARRPFVVSRLQSDTGSIVASERRFNTVQLAGPEGGEPQ